FATYSLVVALPLLTMYSCTKDPCKDVTCENSGTPTEDGDNCICVCTAGYEGDKCQTEVRTKFLGQWQGEEIRTAGTDNYTITIAASGSDVVKITVNNVYNQAFVATATVDGTSFTVASQDVGAGTNVQG